jgi:hypothetical protein
LDPLLGIWILKMDSDSDGSVLELESAAWGGVSRCATSGHVGADVQRVRVMDLIAVMNWIEVVMICFVLLHARRETIYSFTPEQLRILRSTSCYFGIKAPWKHGKQAIDTTSRDS